MSKPIALGNGNLLICLDNFGRVKDFYYHYAGLENHVGEEMVHKIGIWVDNRLSWLDEPTWHIDVGSESETMASNIVAKNSSLGSS